MNMIDGILRRTGDRADVLTSDGSALPVDPRHAVDDGTRVIYGLRPEHLMLADAATALPAKINVVEPTGSETHVLLDMAGSQVSGVFRERIANTPGALLHVLPDATKVSLFDATSRQRINLIRT